MVTTSPDNLFSPDQPSQYNLTVDLAAMQVSTQNALNTKVRYYQATTFSGLPTTSIATGSTAQTTTDNRFFVWNGAKWVPFGGRLPWGSANLGANRTITTTYGALQTDSHGIISGGNATIPAGCGGIYQYSMFFSVENADANVYTRPFVNGVAAGGESLSGGERNFSNMGLLDLNAGDIVTFRARTFAGTHILSGGTSRVSLSYQFAN